MSADNSKGLEGLTIWQKAVSFAALICKEVLPTLPSDEKYALVSQLRRSVQSVPANIAEGYGRFYYQDEVRFCYIARGSLEESFSHLELARRLGYLPEPAFKRYYGLVEELRRMLSGYITFLKQSKKGANEPGSSIREPSGDYETLPDPLSTPSEDDQTD